MFFVGLYTSQKYPISRSIQHQIEHFDVKWFTYHIRATHNNFQSHSCIIKFPRSSRRRDGTESRRPLSSAMILHVPHENFTRFFIFKLKTLGSLDSCMAMSPVWPYFSPGVYCTVEISEGTVRHAFFLIKRSSFAQSSVSLLLCRKVRQKSVTGIFFDY